jgi:hypothetical protein
VENDRAGFSFLGDPGRKASKKCVLHLTHMDTGYIKLSEAQR